MKVAINKKYKYLTFKEHCPEGENFEDWVMQDKFETHSIIEIPNGVNKEYLRFNQFEYDEIADIFTFNIDKYNEYVKRLNNTPSSTENESTEQRLMDLEMAMAEILGGGI